MLYVGVDEAGYGPLLGPLVVAVAALRLTEPDQQCPTLFDLEPLDGPARRCEVRWRRGDTLGVEFV